MIVSLCIVCWREHIGEEINFPPFCVFILCFLSALCERSAACQGPGKTCGLYHKQNQGSTKTIFALCILAAPSSAEKQRGENQPSPSQARRKKEAKRTPRRQSQLSPLCAQTCMPNKLFGALLHLSRVATCESLPLFASCSGSSALAPLKKGSSAV